MKSATGIKACTFLFFTLHLLKMEAQTVVASPVGEYYLRGVMETASGFKLNADSTFQFFFSYGALDRSGEGRWSVQHNTVVFNSKPKPAHDFALVKSGAGIAGKITIQIRGDNVMLLKYVHCKIKGGGKEQEGITNERGLVQFTAQPVDTIELIFEFCAEKKSVFTVQHKDHHYFEFAPEAWLMDVFFQDFRLSLTEDGLAGGHPLLAETSLHYEKTLH